MGRGSYTSSDWSKLKNSRNLSGAASEKEIFKSRECDQRFNPRFIQMREARDSEDHPESTPIIIGLDVTGSMGYLSEKIAKEALNETMMKLYSTDAVKDPAIMFSAYGDYWDPAPLQVTQFESDIRIAEQLLDLWLVDRGQGEVVLSTLWYFAAKHTSLDAFTKRGKKGFLFTIGDDAECRTDDDELADTFTSTFDEKVSMTTKEILEAAKEKFEIFHLFLSDDRRHAESIVKLLPGHTMAITPGDVDAIPEILISTMQMVNGMSLKDAVDQWPETKRGIVEAALRELKLSTKGKGLVF